MSRYERQEKSQRKHTITSSSTPRNGSTPLIPSTPRQRPEWRGPGYKPKKSSNGSTSARPSSSRNKALANSTTQPTSPTSHQAGPDDSSSSRVVPLALQQALLNVFSQAFPVAGTHDVGAGVADGIVIGNGHEGGGGDERSLLTDLSKTLQEVKGALFERDFARAFGSERYLEAYAVRWSPGRALAYAGIWGEVVREFDPLGWDWDAGGSGSGRVDGDEFQRSGRESCREGEKCEGAEESGSMQRTLRLVAFGGGVAEVGAAALMLRSMTPSCAGRPVIKHISPPHTERGQSASPDIANRTAGAAVTSTSAVDQQTTARIDLQLIDIASWSPTITALLSSLTTPPPLSRYASATARASNAAFLSSAALTVSFHQKDVLDLARAELSALVTGHGEGAEAAKGGGPSIVALGFTLNELFGSGIAKTTRFLLELGEVMVKESLLLVIDSPGSYSETTLGGNRNGTGKEDVSGPAGTNGTDVGGIDGDDDTTSNGRAGDSAKGNGTKKKWPMQWLLDHVLLGERHSEKMNTKSRRTNDRRKEWSEKQQDKEQESQEKRTWEKVLVDESRWSRIEEQLRYPVPLENMRMQVHLFRRL